MRPGALGLSNGVAAAGGTTEGGHADVDGPARVCLPCVQLGELVLGTSEADLESFDFAEPAFALGLGDAGNEVVADLTCVVVAEACVLPWFVRSSGTQTDGNIRSCR